MKLRTSVSNYGGCNTEQPTSTESLRAPAGNGCRAEAPALFPSTPAPAQHRVQTLPLHRLPRLSILSLRSTGSGLRHCHLFPSYLNRLPAGLLASSSWSPFLCIHHDWPQEREHDIRLVKNLQWLSIVLKTAAHAYEHAHVDTRTRVHTHIHNTNKRTIDSGPGASSRPLSSFTLCPADIRLLSGFQTHPTSSCPERFTYVASTCQFPLLK